MPDLTLQEIEKQIVALRADMSALVRHGDELSAVLLVLAARLGDPEFVTIKEAALIEERLYGKGTVATVRRRIEEGAYTVVYPQGDKAGRIAVSEIHAVHRKSYATAKAVRAGRESDERKGR